MTTSTCEALYLKIESKPVVYKWRVYPWGKYADVCASTYIEIPYHVNWFRRVISSLLLGYVWERINP